MLKFTAAESVRRTEVGKLVQRLVHDAGMESHPMKWKEFNTTPPMSFALLEAQTLAAVMLHNYSKHRRNPRQFGDDPLCRVLPRQCLCTSTQTNQEKLSRDKLLSGEPLLCYVNNTPMSTSNAAIVLHMLLSSVGRQYSGSLSTARPTSGFFGPHAWWSDTSYTGRMWMRSFQVIRELEQMCNGNNSGSGQ